MIFVWKFLCGHFMFLSLGYNPMSGTAESFFELFKELPDLHWEGEARGLSQFEASLGYTVNSSQPELHRDSI